MARNMCLIPLFLILLANTATVPARAAPSTSTPTRCTITLTPPTLAIACTGPGPVSLAPLRPAATPITTTSFTGAALVPNDPACGAAASSNSTAAPAITAVVALCSSAAHLHIADSAIAGVSLPSGAILSSRASKLAAALAVMYNGRSMHVTNLTANGVSYGSALLIRAAATDGAAVTVTNCTFSNNTAGAGSGGGLAVQLVSPQPTTPLSNSSRCSVVLEGNTFTRNSASSGGGVAVQLLHSGPSKSASQVPGSINLRGTNVFNGCKATAGGGGGLLIDVGATHQFSIKLGGDTLFELNRASGAGGAVLVSLQGATKPSVLLTGDASFTGNVAKWGGGLAVDMSSARNGVVQVTGGTQFTGNAAMNGTGAGLLLNGTRAAAVRLVVTNDALFKQNRAMADSAGALGGAGVAAVLDGCQGCGMAMDGRSTVVGNAASIGARGLSMGLSMKGGGVMVQADSCVRCMVRVGGAVQFAGNTVAGSGGGLSVAANQAHRMHVLLEGRLAFVNNTASMGGGGLQVEIEESKGVLAEVLGASQWVRNNASDGAGARLVFTAGDTAVNITGQHMFARNSGGSYIADGVLAGRCTTAGAGLFVLVRQMSNMTAVVSGARFMGNDACGGAGLTFQYFVNNDNSTALASVNATLHDLLFTNNSAHDQGGGMLLDVGSASNGARVRINSSRWVGNSAASGGGGLAVRVNESTLTAVQMDRLEFEVNSADAGAGGALLLTLGGVQLDKAKVSTNSTVPAGRAAVTNDIFVSLGNSVFRGNSVANGVAGAVFLQGTSAAVWYAATYRTIPWWRYSTPDPENLLLSMAASNLTMVGNQATYGGAWFVTGSQLRVRDSVLAGNEASWYGGALYSKASSVWMEACQVESNRAGWSGGAVYALVADDFGANMLTVNQSTISNNTALSQGGGLYLQAGQAYLDNTTISGNSAGQQGGGIAYINICPNSSASCTLQLLNSTQLSDNSALSGGAVFLAIPGNNGVNATQLNHVVKASSNTGEYAAGVSFAPNTTAVTVQHASFTVPSSTDSSGLIPLVATVGQASVQVAVRFCRNLAGSDPVGEAYLIGTGETSRNGGSAVFRSLRLLQGVPQRTYCLQVHLPDYPIVTPAVINVTIRDCIPGEIPNKDGCITCPANQYSFSPADRRCPLCSPYANCTGGPVLVPNSGFWHSAANSSNVQPCPNHRACQGNRSALHICQAGRHCSSGYTYHTLQCSTGYGGHLCGSCRKDLGYGQGAYLRCSKCMSTGRSVAVLLVLAAACCCLLVWVSFRSLRDCVQQITPATITGNLALSHASTSVPPPPITDLPQQPSSTQLLSPGIALPQSREHLAPAPSHVNDQEHPPRSNSNMQSEQPVPKYLPVNSSTTHGQGSSRSALASRGGGLELSDVFKVLVVHLQYLSIVGNLLVDWPSALRWLIDITRMLFVANSSQIVSWDCLGNIGNGTMMVLSIVVPLLIILLACALMWLLARLAARVQPGKATWLTPLVPTANVHASSSSSQHIYSMIKDAVATTALVGLFLFYSLLVSSSLTAFTCINVDGDSYWIKDMEVKCWTSQHLQASMGVGVLGTLVFCVLVPLATIWWLARNRAQVGQPGFHQRYGFLYRLYSPQYCYWEGVVCMQTIALVCVDLFGRRHGTFYQLLLLVMVLVLNYSLVAALRPFRCVELQLLYALSIVTLLLTCLGVQALLRGYLLDTVSGLLQGARNGIVMTVLLLNIGFICLCLYLLGKAAAGVAKKVLTAASTAISKQSFKSITSIMRKPSMPRVRRRLSGLGSWSRRRSSKMSTSNTAASAAPAALQQQSSAGLANLSSIVSDC